jgi:formate dehydrogenase major subunit
MNITHEADYGTPASRETATVSIEIDGIATTARKGDTILRAAREFGVDIPKLCATDSLKAFGSCRLCVVEVVGRNGYPASCTTLVEEGMKIRTQTPAVARLRRNVMELYISDHPLDCLTCSANGDCELQDMAGAVGLRDVRYGFAGENHLDADIDDSNPYFSFDPAKCIVCSRCVRACDEVQGTFALTIEGRGFDSKIAASAGEKFLDSECVSCGACIQACPTATLMEKSIIDHGQPEHSVLTTCAYCGVGCSFKADMKGDQVVRMTPYKDGGANQGHSCIKGRFAWGYASHKERVLDPMIRENTDDPWRKVSWDEAISYAAKRFKDIQEKYGRKSVGGITSSRCTNEEVFIVQKLVRAAFGNNNVDTCARVCHSPTGFGLNKTLGTSAGTQPFESVMDADCIIVIGANPTQGHPVFASQMKRRLREGANLIVVDPRKIELVRTPHFKADYHLALKPGTNVPIINSLAHVIVKEGLAAEDYIAERCDLESYEAWKKCVTRPEYSPESTAIIAGVSADDIRSAARMFANAKNGAIYYGLGVTEHSQGSTMVMGMANLAMATGNIGRSGVGVNPLRGQNNVQGSCDMGSFPHELPGYRPVGDDEVRGSFEKHWGVTLDAEPGYRIPNMFDAAINDAYKGMYVQGEDIAQSDPNTKHVEQALGKLECLVVQDLFLNETSKFAHVFFPGTSFLEKDGTFINAERRINRVRPVMEPRTGKAEWLVTQELAQALGYDMSYDNEAQIMDEIAALTPTFQGVSFDFLDRVGSVQWPCNEKAPMGTPIMHVDNFVRGKGLFVETDYVPTEERTTRKFPLILTTGRTLAQYNVGAQTRRTPNIEWYKEDVLEIHPSDAELRGIHDGDRVSLASRKGDITLCAKITERIQPGVVYTTFHDPETGANVVTTEYSDWATSCPEYKVTAVQVAPAAHRSQWQHQFEERAKSQGRILEPGEST